MSNANNVFTLGYFTISQYIYEEGSAYYCTGPGKRFMKIIYTPWIGEMWQMSAVEYIKYLLDQRFGEIFTR